MWAVVWVVVRWVSAFCGSWYVATSSSAPPPDLQHHNNDENQLYSTQKLLRCDESGLPVVWWVFVGGGVVVFCVGWLGVMVLALVRMRAGSLWRRKAVGRGG